MGVFSVVVHEIPLEKMIILIRSRQSKFGLLLTNNCRHRKNGGARGARQTAEATGGSYHLQTKNTLHREVEFSKYDGDWH